LVFYHAFFWNNSWVGFSNYFKSILEVMQPQNTAISEFALGIEAAQIVVVL
jgi:hypothetical protein